MALYAFDGTWNRDKPGSDRDTNVVWFRDGYTEKAYYYNGVGTRFGKLGRAVGGLTGKGGRSRVRKARGNLAAAFARGDTVVDIVGFSRGAALALHFANKIERKGVETSAGTVFPRIRFLGLWDVVPSFGAPSIPLNIGWDLDLPECVERCCHAMALDERRHMFKVRRLEARVEDVSGDSPLREVWFRGVHSDVGGGNKNPGLSSIALDWMFAQALERGLPLDETVLDKNRARCNPESGSSIHGLDPIKQSFRRLRPTDCCHESVTFRTDTGKRRYNNPPHGLAVVDNRGVRLRDFVRR